MADSPELSPPGRGLRWRLRGYLARRREWKRLEAGYVEKGLSGPVFPEPDRTSEVHRAMDDAARFGPDSVP
jgi:hypothetical protein